MLYGKYKNVRNAAWQALIDFRICSLPVRISDITDKLGIKIVGDSDVHELNSGDRGATLNIGSNWYIIVDNTASVPVQRFTAAHELGHILLGHMMVDKIRYRTFDKRTEEEQSADMFAARLLAPACILHEIGVTTPDQIKTVCSISITAAEIRAERMKELEHRNKFYLHPLERQVRDQFRDFISSYNSYLYTKFE